MLKRIDHEVIRVEMVLKIFASSAHKFYVKHDVVWRRLIVYLALAG